MFEYLYLGIKTPAIYFVDLDSNKIYMEHIVDSLTVRDYICQVYARADVDHIETLTPLVQKIGTTLGILNWFSVHRFIT